MIKLLEFDQWRRQKLAVVHMKKSPYQMETALDELKIPYIKFEQDDIEKIDINEFCGLILGGGRLDKGEMPPELPPNLLNSAIPKLGICLGHEILGEFLGSKLIECNGGFDLGEDSEVIAEIKPDELFEGIETPSSQIVKMEHFYMLDKEPIGSKLIAATNLTPIAGFHHIEKQIWGLQFHPEKDWIKYIALKNFYNICKK